jgi:hypothetical protein
MRSNLKFNATDMMKSLVLNITITGFTKLRLRLKIATLFFRFGAWIMGVGIEIREDRK